MKFINSIDKGALTVFEIINKLEVGATEMY